jgi:hypothetical protein
MHSCVLNHTHLQVGISFAPQDVETDVDAAYAPQDVDTAWNPEIDVQNADAYHS